MLFTARGSASDYTAQGTAHRMDSRGKLLHLNNEPMVGRQFVCINNKKNKKCLYTCVINERA